MPRWKSLVLAAVAVLTVTVAQQVVYAYERAWHELESAVARRPEHRFFVQRWSTICREAKTPDKPGKDLSHAAERWERCRDSFNAATGCYPVDLRDPGNSRQAAETLGHSMHYLQDNLAPRGSHSWDVHLEIANQARGLLAANNTESEAARAEAARRRFFEGVDAVRASLQSKDRLDKLFNEAGREQRQQHRTLLELSRTKGDLPIQDRSRGVFWRYRRFAELSEMEREQFRSLASQTMVASAAYAERAYELYLTEVDPDHARNLTWNFDPVALENALEGVDEVIDEHRARDGRPATEPSTEELDLAEVVDLADMGGPAETKPPTGEVVTHEEAKTDAVHSTAKSNIATHETRTEGSDELLPVVAKGGPWTVRAEGGVLTLSAITFTIQKDGTATLSACRFQAPPLIERADVRFRAATRSDIHVAPDRPEIALRVQVSGTATVNGRDFLGGRVAGNNDVTAVVTRRADGSWLVEGIIDIPGFPRSVVLKPVQ